MTWSRRMRSTAGAALGALTLVLFTATPSSAEEHRHFNLVAHNGVDYAGNFAGPEPHLSAWLIFHSQREVFLRGHVHDTQVDGWCAMVSVTVNDGFPGASTFRRETCGYLTKKFVDETINKTRLYTIKVAVGLRYPPTGQIRWGESVKYQNPYW
ncbi:hypothetical protein ACIBF7_17990 [Nonomuraea sp. NPDC050478]|uniref:hypothetical protein n=1 Tax=Nonomuraea sp. NPDC050478 TaxID=3364365 RepID=UPI0037BD125E